jgi:hypothetical protein
MQKLLLMTVIRMYIAMDLVCLLIEIHFLFSLLHSVFCPFWLCLYRKSMNQVPLLNLAPKMYPSMDHWLLVTLDITRLIAQITNCWWKLSTYNAATVQLVFLKILVSIQVTLKIKMLVSVMIRNSKMNCAAILKQILTLIELQSKITLTQNVKIRKNVPLTCT